jgi:predicted nucleotidyltransferase
MLQYGPVTQNGRTGSVALGELGEAERASAELTRREEVLSICLLGSVARGEPTPTSDIDMLVITSQAVAPTDLLEELDDGGIRSRISLIVQSREVFRWLAEEGALFAHHVRTEGRVLFDRDGWLEHQLHVCRDVGVNPGLTLDWARRELQLYGELARFNGVFLYPLARLYTIGRAIAIALTAQDGKPEFSKDGPFELAGRRRPTLHHELRRLSALRPFREFIDGKAGVELPFDHRHAEERVVETLDDLETLLQAADA